MAYCIQFKAKVKLKSKLVGSYDENIQHDQIWLIFTRFRSNVTSVDTDSTIKRIQVLSLRFMISPLLSALCDQFDRVRDVILLSNVLLVYVF